LAPTIEQQAARRQLDALLSTWPNVAPGEPREVDRLREMLERDPVPIRAGARREHDR
jgi:hypothetical protein